MTLRSPAFAALAVLFVAVTAVFVLVSEAGVETRVFTADPTLTPVPTVGPTPTPLPDASAENWVVVGTNQYQYRGDIDVQTSLTVSTSVLTEFINASGLQAPPEDAAFPIFVLMTELRDLLSESAQTNGIALEPEAITGPVMEVFGNVPVTLLRVRAQPQTLANGTEYPGAELVFAWFQNGDNIVRVEYEGRGAPDPVIYNDLRAWLEANVPELAGIAPAEEATPEATPEAEPNAEATETPAVAEPTEEPAAEPAEAAETPAAAEPTEEPAAEPAEAAETPAAAEPTEEPADDGAATPVAAAPGAADQTATSGTPAPQGPWNPRGEAIWQHADDPSAVVATGTRALSEVANELGYTPAEGEALTPLGLLQFEKDQLAAEIAASAEVTTHAFDGPTERQIEGVTLYSLAFEVTASNQTVTMSRYTFLGLIPVDEDQVSAISFQYTYDDQRSAAIEADFETWLSDNVARLATLAE